MQLPGGGFAASLDADSGGEEGAFYTWDRSEVESILGDQAEAFFAAYSLSSAPHWEGKPILHRTNTGIEKGAYDAQLRALLGALRSRVRPGRDGKALADWNGLLIAALAEAATSLDRPDWLEAARSAYRFVRESADAAGRLPHSILGERRLFPAMSSDYAAMANAAVALYAATGESPYLDDAVRDLATLDRWYCDEQNVGHYLTASDSADVPLRIRGDVDEAIPSATAQLIEAFARVATATNRLDLYDRAWAIAKAATGRVRKQAYGQVGIVNACTLLESARKLVVVEDPAAPSLTQLARRRPDPRRVDLMLPLGAEPVELPGSVQLDTTSPAAWLCVGQACLPPMTGPAELERALRPG
jgi:uncharacterized protein YyaL (SSP411 family)